MKKLPRTVFSLTLIIGDYYFDNFSAITIKQQCDGIGLSGVSTSQLTVSVPTAEYNLKTPKNNDMVKFIIQEKDVSKEYIFFIANRRKNGEKVDFVCYDRMAFSDVYVDEENLNYTEDIITAADLVTEIAGLCGITKIDSSINTMGYFAALPFKKENIAGKTARALLDEISKAWCGFFKVTYNNTLCFITFSHRAISGTAIKQHSTIISGNEKGPIAKVEVHGDEIFTAGDKSADVFCTLKINTSFANQELADALLARTSGIVYGGWNCSKAIIPFNSIPDITTIMVMQGDLADSRYVNNATLTFTSNGVFFSGGANETTENEFEYVGALTRKIEERIKDSEKLGNNTMITRYQGLIHLGEEKTSNLSNNELTKRYAYSSVDTNGIVEFDGAMVSNIVPSAASISEDKTEAIVTYGEQKYKYKIKWSGNNIVDFKKEKIT